jgi:hypothetical protein
VLTAAPAARAIAEVEMKAAWAEAEATAATHRGKAVRQVEFEMPARTAALPENHVSLLLSTV